MLDAKVRLGYVGAMLFILSIAVNATADDSSKTWREQGPGPILNGANTVVPPQNVVAGAINAIAISPTDPNVLYVGTVNGGIWKTTNATSASPTWTPLTDESLPALSINSLAISPVSSNTLFAGTGSTSSFGFDGSPGFGVARSTNGGQSWRVLASSTFAGRRINSIVPTALGNGDVVLAATLFDGGGVYRSTNRGVLFVQISGGAGTGLPSGGVSNLVADPGNASRFYAGLPSSSGGGSNAGVYRSTDGGLTWTSVSSGLTGLSSSLRILLSVHNSTGNNVVYAAIIGTNGKLSGVFRSTNQGGSWAALGVPVPEIFPGSQGIVHGAIVADPTNPNVVFISGDRQASPFPNSNGCTSFSGNTFRGNAALLPANPWTSVDCTGANGTSPHPDSRTMVFDSNGNLLQVNDGGIYRLSQPNSATRLWSSTNGSIRPTEFHSVAYDSLSNVVFGGTQDNGTPIQSTPGSLSWNEFLGGDGGNVAVDNDQTAHPGTSIRYTSFQFFGFFNRSTWNAGNTLVSGPTAVGLLITSGPGTGFTLFQFDPNIQFYQPFVLNAINPSRMLIGTASIYESLNKGDSLANLGFTGFFINALAYGGRLNGVPNPDVFYVGAGPTIRHRVLLSGPITTLSTYPGSTVRGLVMDPQNYKHVFVLDNQSRVWASFDEGVSWSNLTANLPTLTPDVRAIEILRPGATVEEEDSVLIVGGLGGVFQRKLGTEDEEDDSWHVLGKHLPHGLVLDLHFNSADNILLAGILGRGSWTLPIVSGDDEPGVAAIQGIYGQPTVADTSSVEAAWAEGGGFKLDVPMMPPVAMPAKE